MKFAVRHCSKLVPVEPAVFRSGNSTCDVIYLTIDDRLILEGFQSVFGSSICEMSVDSEAQFGEICLKAVVKVALSLQRLASTRQVKISNHTMIVLSQLPPKKQLPSCTLKLNSCIE